MVLNWLYAGITQGISKLAAWVSCAEIPTSWVWAGCRLGTEIFKNLPGDWRAAGAEKPTYNSLLVLCILQKNRTAVTHFIPRPFQYSPITLSLSSLIGRSRQGGRGGQEGGGGLLSLPGRVWR